MTNNHKISRRDSMHLGVGLLGSGGLVNLLRLQGQAAEATVAPRKPTSCILVWLDGGPSHFETFDPKPEAPLEIRGEFDAIETRLPGGRFSQTLPRLAA